MSETHIQKRTAEKKNEKEIGLPKKEDLQGTGGRRRKQSTRIKTGLPRRKDITIKIRNGENPRRTEVRERYMKDKGRERERERERERLILKGAEKSPDETVGGYERHNE